MDDSLIEIDGSFGEGGGQIIRTALALAMITGRPFRIDNIRANRKKPGLRRQHLTGVQTAARICGAEVENDAIGSRQLLFVPGQVVPGEYRVDIGSAGSTTLVLQAVLPALLTATGPSQLTLCGGTHNTLAPPYDFLAEAFLPLVCRMGPQVEAHLVRHGFYPAGGGELRVTVQPAVRWQRLELLTADRPRLSARALVSRLPRHVAQRELDVVRRALNVAARNLEVVEVDDSPGPGNAVMIRVDRGEVTELFTGFGQRGVPAETVARAAVREARSYLKAEVPVGPHLADQLLLPMALAGGGSFRTQPATLHTTTNAAVIARFLDVEVRVSEESQRACRVDVIV